MALRYLSSALRRAPERHDDHEPPPLADTSEGTEIGEQMEKEMDEFLEKLKIAGMEINEEMAKIIQEERARIPQAIRDAADMEAKKRRSKALVTRTVFGLSLLTIATASGLAGYWIGVNLCIGAIFNKEDALYLFLGYGLKYFVEGRRLGCR